MGEVSLEHLKSEKLYIDGLFWSKAYNFSVRKFQRNYMSYHWRWCKKKKKTVVAWKITERIWLIFIRAFECVEIYWWACFVQSIQRFRWKNTEQLCLMTLKSDAKYEDKLTFGSKMTWGIWWILMRAVASLKICTLMCYFSQ